MFQPTDLNDLKLWLDFADGSTITKDGSDRIEKIEDKSGEGNDATQTDNAKKPLLIDNLKNGKSGARFDGADDFLKSEFTSSFTTPTQRTIFVVYNQIATSSVSQYILESYGASSTNFWYAGSLNLPNNETLTSSMRDGSNVAQNAIISSAQQVGSFKLITHNHANGSLNNLFEKYGTSSKSANNGSNFTTNSATHLGYYFGSDRVEDRHGNIEICEVLIYFRKLSDFETYQVESYLNSKWALEIPIDNMNIHNLGVMIETSLGDNMNIHNLGAMIDVQLPDNMNIHNLGIMADVRQRTEVINGFKLEIMENIYLAEASDGTSSTQLIFEGAHGLTVGDQIVNENIRVAGIRQSAVITQVISPNTVNISPAISGQSSGNIIRAYKYIDRTDVVKINTLTCTEQIGGESKASFYIDISPDMIAGDTFNQFNPIIGSNVRISNESNNRRIFGGTIGRIEKKLISRTEARIIQFFFECDSWKNVPKRVNIKREWTETNTGQIVEDLINDYLGREGIRKGTIDFGSSVLLYPETGNIPKNLTEILDDMAELSGCFWYIDGNKFLQFIPNETSTLNEAIIDEEDPESFKDVMNLSIEEDIAEYINKQFINAGQYITEDSQLIDVIFAKQDKDQIEDIQDLVGGSGIYGEIFENKELSEDERFIEYNVSAVSDLGGGIVEVETVEDHELESGDTIFHIQSSKYMEIEEVIDSKTFTVKTSETIEADNVIVYFIAAQKQVNLLLDRHKRYTKIIFRTKTNIFAVGDTVRVKLPTFKINEEKEFLVIETTFSDSQNVIFEDVIMIEKASDNAIPQYYNFREYFRDIKKRK
jgi:hypothetical protein